MSDRGKSIVPGAILILVGLFLFLREFDLVYLGWRDLYPVILLGLGGLFALSAFSRRDKGAVFAAAMFLVLGLFFLFRNFGIFSLDYYFYYPSEYWPIFLLAVGAGFITLFIFKTDDWAVLIPGGTLLLFGALFMLRNAGFLDWLHLADLWPIILIAIGASIVIRGFRQRSINSQ